MAQLGKQTKFIFIWNGVGRPSCAVIRVGLGAIESSWLVCSEPNLAPKIPAQDQFLFGFGDWQRADGLDADFSFLLEVVWKIQPEDAHAGGGLQDDFHDLLG